MSEKNRIKEVQKKLEETTNRSSELDAKLFESFKNGKTKEVDLDFVKVMSNSLRTTAKSVLTNFSKSAIRLTLPSKPSCL